jgi:hypothetical protein
MAITPLDTNPVRWWHSPTSTDRVSKRRAVDRCEEWETMGELIEPLRQYAI